MSILWHNHSWKNDSEALFSFTDRVRLGDGIFDTLLCVDGRFIHTHKHYVRLQKSAQIFGLQLTISCSKFEEILQHLVQKNAWHSGLYAINTLITRGPGKRGLHLPEHEQTQIVIRGTKAPAPPYPPIDLIVAKTVRRNQHSPLSRIKSCNYGDNILALIEAKDNGGTDALLLNGSGNVTCASTSNIYAIIQEKIYTPPLKDGVMNGVSRQVLIEAMDVTEQSLSESDIEMADDLYLSNSVYGFRKVASINGKTLPGAHLQIDNTLHLR